MDNSNHARTELLRQIQKLLTAVGTLEACIENHTLAADDAGLDLARAKLHSAAAEAARVSERHRGAKAPSHKSHRKVPPLGWLQVSADNAERKAAQLRAEGDEAGAKQASEHAATLRLIVSDEVALERRQGFTLVPPARRPPH